MKNDLDVLQGTTLAELAQVENEAGWEALKVRTLGKSGWLTQQLKALGACDPDERRQRGSVLNQTRDALNVAFAQRKSEIEALILAAQLDAERVDVTLPVVSQVVGLLHPIHQTIDDMVEIFGTMGFGVADGPDIESQWHNFSALNTPEHHPARTEHDTFYLPRPRPDAPEPVLRTQTSGVQIRTLLGQKPPLRVIAPGRTYRADHDATHSPMFHQCEGILIDRGITLANLKYCLIEFLRAFFGKPDLPVRFRASYFPFTEPSMEVDIGWSRKTGGIGEGDDWLEVLGAGMVQSRVLANCGVDPEIWQGFAFGMGVERLTMLKCGIPDLRSFYESDLRWLRHYGFSALAALNSSKGV